MTVFPITLTMRREGGEGAFVVEPESISFKDCYGGVDQIGAEECINVIQGGSFNLYLRQILDCVHCPAARSLEESLAWILKVGMKNDGGEVGLVVGCRIHQALEVLRGRGDNNAITMVTPCEENSHSIEVRTQLDAR